MPTLKFAYAESNRKCPYRARYDGVESLVELIVKKVSRQAGRHSVTQKLANRLTADACEKDRIL